MVPTEVSLYHVQTELETSGALIVELFGLAVDTAMLSEEDLRIRVTGVSRVDQEMHMSWR